MWVEAEMIHTVLASDNVHIIFACPRSWSYGQGPTHANLTAVAMYTYIYGNVLSKRFTWFSFSKMIELHTKATACAFKESQMGRPLGNQVAGCVLLSSRLVPITTIFTGPGTHKMTVPHIDSTAEISIEHPRYHSMPDMKGWEHAGRGTCAEGTQRPC